MVRNGVPSSMAVWASLLSSRLVVVRGLACLGLTAAACSLTVDAGREQCSKDSDCEARGAAFSGSVCVESVCLPEPAWSCLGRGMEAETPSPGPRKYRAPFFVRHLVNQQPLPGVQARICRRIDVMCQNALTEGILTDAQGRVTLEVDEGFDGYAYFEGTDIIPGLYFFNPVRRDLPETMISISSAEIISLLAAQAGTTQQADRGVVLLSPTDCTGKPAAGVTLTPSGSEPGAVTFYSEGNLPSRSATQTDAAGYGGVLNVAAGSITITATIAKTQRRLGQVTLLARPGAISYGSIVPNGT